MCISHKDAMAYAAAPDLMPPSCCAAQVQLGQQLLRVARQVDALEGRFASAMGHRPPGAREATAEAEDRLTSLEKGLSTSSAGANSRKSGTIDIIRSHQPAAAACIPLKQGAV
jgi:hypothetical protein